MEAQRQIEAPVRTKEAAKWGGLSGEEVMERNWMLVVGAIVVLLIIAVLI